VAHIQRRNWQQKEKENVDSEPPIITLEEGLEVVTLKENTDGNIGAEY